MESKPEVKKEVVPTEVTDKSEYEARLILKKIVRVKVPVGIAS